jgi:hypothetical protein
MTPVPAPWTIATLVTATPRRIAEWCVRPRITRDNVFSLESVDSIDVTRSLSVITVFNRTLPFIIVSLAFKIASDLQDHDTAHISVNTNCIVYIKQPEAHWLLEYLYITSLL